MKLLKKLIVLIVFFSMWVGIPYFIFIQTHSNWAFLWLFITWFPAGLASEYLED